MLTGRVVPSFGDASVAGKSVTRELNAVRQRSGICPQFDALFPLVPPRQQLAAYCRIKGVNPADITVLVERYLARLDLTKKAENRTDTLSGGQRRKLSVAVALVGDPNIVFLDEPTTGMDPEIRRFVWGFVEEIAPRRVVVLTSHSMEEVEALSTRVGIMVNGNLRALGSIGDLKRDHGQSLELSVKLHDDRTTAEGRDAVERFVSETYPGAVLSEHASELQPIFQIPSAVFSMKTFFGILENKREELGIADFQITSTTMEQVFRQITKSQLADERAENSASAQ